MRPKHQGPPGIAPLLIVNTSVDGDDRPAMVGVGSALCEYMWRFLVPRYVLSLESERM